MRKFWSVLFSGILAVTYSFADPSFAQTDSSAVAGFEDRIKALEQELKFLKRIVEVDREVAFTKTQTAPIVTAGAGKDGFSLRSPDGNFKLRIGGVAQADARFFPRDIERGTTNTFVERKVRPILEGTVYKNFDFRIMTDFGSGQAVVQDSYVDVNYVPWLKLRAGKFKEPVGIEQLQSDTSLLFMERGLPSNLLPNRDVGAQLFGDVNFGPAAITYAAGLFNGVVDGASSDGDTNRDKDFAGRIFIEPFKNTDIEALSGFGFGIGGTYGHQKGALPSYKTPGQVTFFRYGSNVKSDDVIYRITPQASYYLGPFGFFGEYVGSSQEVFTDVKTGKGKSAKIVGDFPDRVENQSWQVAASYVLTGEKASYKGVKPLKPFLKDGGLGAVELVSRFGGLYLDRDVYQDNFSDEDRNPRTANSFGIGINWYLNENVKLVLDYERTIFGLGGLDYYTKDRQSEQFVGTRFQLAF